MNRQKLFQSMGSMAVLAFMLLMTSCNVNTPEDKMDEKKIGLHAIETEITFSGKSGPGIVVDYGGSSRLIFWENAQFIPCWDLGDGLWMFNQWVETATIDNGHCYEPMMDMENRYTRAKIEVNGPARTIVHWHYALCDNQYRIFNGNTTTDEYYTTYPDGVTIRRVVIWPGDESDYGGSGVYWEVGEWNILMAEGVLPDDVIDDPVLQYRNVAGDSTTINWPIDQGGYLCDVNPGVADWNETIGIMNMKDRPQSYAVIPSNQMLFPHTSCGNCGNDHVHFTLFGGNAMTCNHWPMYDKDDWVGWKDAGEEVGTTMCTKGFGGYSYTYNHRWKDTKAGKRGYFRHARPPRPTTLLMLNGVTDKGDDYITQVAASWLNPARANAPGWVYEGYDYTQMAYVFRPIDLDAVSIEVNIQPRSEDVLNPVIIIEKFAKEVSGVKVNGKMFQNFTSQIENEKETVIWIGQTIAQNSSIEVLFR